MKAILAVVILGMLAAGAYFAGTSFSPSKKPAPMGERPEFASVDIPGKPDRAPDISGNLVSVESGRLVVAKRDTNVSGTSEADRQAMRDRMQSMSDADQQALREERQKQGQSGEKVPVPVSEATKFVRVVNGAVTTVSASELEANRGVSVWTGSDGTAEFVVEGFFGMRQ